MKRVLVAWVLLAGVAHGQSCPLPGEHAQIRLTLFFGRDRDGMAPVSDAEWRGFAANVLSRSFQAGFTETDGSGEWRNPKSGRLVREPSKIIDVVTDQTGLAAKVETVTGIYRREFHQQSVGVVTEPVCAAF